MKTPSSFGGTSRIIPSAILGTLLACSYAVLAEVEFYRNCATAVQCVFEPRGSSDRVYLDCQNGRCACSNFPAIADVPVWNLDWNPSSQDCLIGEFGPCGRENGLELSCRPDLQCINSRCRSSQKIRTYRRGEYCKDDIDCEPGLKCKVLAFYFQTQKSCVSAEDERQKGEEERERQDRQTDREGSTISVSRETMKTSVSFNVNDKSPPPPTVMRTEEVQNKTMVPEDTAAPSVAFPVPRNPTETNSDHFLEDDEDVPMSSHNSASIFHQNPLLLSMCTSTLISIFAHTHFW